MKKLIGYLRERHELSEQHECSYSYDFELLEEGSGIRDVCCKYDTPTNVLIEAVFEDDCIVQWDYADAPLTRKDVDRKDVALVQVVEQGDLNKKTWEEKFEFYIDNVKEEARELEHFLKLVDQGNWTEIKVTGYVVQNTTHHGRGLFFPFTNPKITEQLREQNPEGYDRHNYWHGRGGFKSGILGEAYRNSYKAWTYGGTLRTVKHEQGHAFGCPHSSTSGNEYGDPTCIMAKTHAGFCAPQMTNLLQMSPSMIRRREEDDCFFLVPVEVPETDVRENEHKIVLIQGENDIYSLSCRKESYQSILGLSEYMKSEIIHVHKVRTNFGNTLGKPVYVNAVPANKSETIDGVTVHNHGMKDGVIQFTTNDAQVKSYPKAQAPIPSDPIIKEHEGVWHNSDYVFQGIDMWVLPEKKKIIGYWFTQHPQGKHTVDLHRKHNGREWYVLDGDIKDGYAKFDILETNSDGEQKTIGYGVFRVTNNNAVFRFYTRAHGRDHIKLTKLTPVKELDENEGIWETDKYEGYTVSKYYNEENERDEYLAYYFGYNGWQNDWAVFSGTDLTTMTKYSPESMYKSFYGEANSNGAVNIEEIISSAKRIL